MPLTGKPDKDFTPRSRRLETDVDLLTRKPYLLRRLKRQESNKSVQGDNTQRISTVSYQALASTKAVA